MALRPDQQILEDAAEAKLAAAEAAYAASKQAEVNARNQSGLDHQAIFTAQRELRDLQRSFRRSSPLGDPIDL